MVVNNETLQKPIITNITYIFDESKCFYQPVPKQPICLL